MNFIIILFFSILFIYLLWDILTRKYLNPYQLYILFGPKGCGKSTLLHKLIKYYTKRKWVCYCNIGDSTSDLCIPIPLKKFLPRLAQASKDPSLRSKLRSDLDKAGYYDCPDHIQERAVIFCDEINLLFDNRDFKNFSSSMQSYFRLQRHYKHIFIGFSQTFDCDKKIRDLADYLYIISKKARIFVRCKGYKKKIVVVRPKGENSTRDVASMTDDFIPLGFFSDFFCQFHAYIPKWVKQHDSFKSVSSTSESVVVSEPVSNVVDLNDIFNDLPSADGRGAAAPEQ